MALEVLFGPVDITSEGVPFASFLNNFGMQAVYVQGLGLLAMAVDPTGGSFGTFAVQLDGTAYQRSDLAATGSTLLLDRRGGSRGLALQDAHSYYSFDWLAGRAAETPFLTPGGILANPAKVICEDRLLRIVTNTVSSSPITDGLTYTPEYTFAGTSPGGNVTVSRARGDNLICIAWGSTPGQIRFYDVVAKTQVGGVLYVGEAHEGVWCIPKYDIFLELKTRQLKVLANAVRPATLANPTALATVQAGRAVQVRTRLLGAQSEPCVDERVNWSITAGAGALEDAQSVTDADGYAYNRLVAPVGSSGNVTVQATLGF